MGSPAVAAWIAHVAFWTLLAYGAMWEEIDAKIAVVFVVLWIVGLYALPSILSGMLPFSSFVAILDIVLVFLIFKGDVRLTG